MGVAVKHGPLPAPALEWRDGAPHAQDFDDIYFNPDDGLAETRHVFLRGNGLPEAWAGKGRFVIGELGFGTGLNFLAAWDLWRNSRSPNAQLHFLSVEGAPLARDQLAEAHRAWPEFADLSRHLREAYPPLARGVHLLHLPDGVHLHLLFDEGLEALRRLEARVDAWFLDGFAPSKNPDMWSEQLFTEIARCSAPGATAATFTVAGVVRRGLQEAGFEIAKVPGFGRKKEMLGARMTGASTPASEAPWFTLPPARCAERIAIIGAGIAGISVALALKAQGVKATTFEAAPAPCMGGSGTPSGLVMPRLSGGDDTPARFYAAAIHHAVALYRRADALSTHGAKRLPQDERQLTRMEKMARSGLYAACELSLGDDLYVSSAGTLDTEAFVQWALARVDIRYKAPITRLDRDGDDWLLRDESSKPLLRASHVVVANGPASAALLASTQLPIAPQQGQVIRLSGEAPPLPLSFGGYIAPQPDGLWAGSTHEDIDAGEPANTSKEADAKILAGVEKQIPGFTKGRKVLDRWVGLRATTPDRTPIAGPVCAAEDFAAAYAPLAKGIKRDLPMPPYLPGLFALTGLGSRGFVTAPLLGELVAAQILGLPLPLEKKGADLVHPMRFQLRAIKRRVSDI